MTSTTFTTTCIFALLAPVLCSPLGLNYSSFPFITSYTALGDSYATGYGAGTNTLSVCRPFSDAYPAQLAKAIGPVLFQNAACGGAVTSTVIWDQLGWIGESDLVTLTVGGNEADFFRVLNECVYQWHPLRTCEAELRTSRRVIESSRFGESYAKMVRLGVHRMKPAGRLLVTGYATFFNEDTSGCDRISFSKRNPEQFLTQELRRELNQLVRLLNHVIRDTAEAAGAEYVNIDEMFAGHRFCEDGVSEPDTSRSDTWFFNLGDDDSPASESKTERYPSSQEILLARSGNWYDNVAKVFHPTSNGHRGIRDAIVKHLQGE
jgi:GDSL-like Lipase/Acylhydrolase family